jgi:hypothetical protein
MTLNQGYEGVAAKSTRRYQRSRKDIGESSQLHSLFRINKPAGLAEHRPRQTESAMQSFSKPQLSWCEVSKPDVQRIVADETALDLQGKAQIAMAQLHATQVDPSSSEVDRVAATACVARVRAWADDCFRLGY